MAKAKIIEDLGSGHYRIQRMWAGREWVQSRIFAYNKSISELQAKYDGMPVTTDDEIFQKHIVGLQIASLETKVRYLTNNFPEDKIVFAWCADYSEGLSGEVGTIDIAGEYTADVNIRPGQSSNYNGARDGELHPGIALGPWTSLLNQMIYPGWQKFAPLHRYAWIVEGTIDYDANTCAVAIMPTFSLMNYSVNKAATGGGDEASAAGAGIRSSRVKNYNVNLGNTLGTDEIELVRRGILEKNYAHAFYVQNAAMAHPGFIDFIERNPTHPISQVTRLETPIYMTEETYIQLARICRHFDYFFRYESDQSGYEISDYWNVMYDLGDPWYWTPSYKGEIQNEFTFGSVNLLYDNSGLIIGLPDDTIESYYSWGSYSLRNIELEFAANQLHEIGPLQKRLGDCEDFVLSKMQAIIEAGIIPAGNLQVLLCYVVNAGYHAVLGIQTQNRGFLISDQRDYGQLWEIEQLKRTHIWESFSIATAAGGDNVKWAKAQLILKDVPIEYMSCHAQAFAGGDSVIVEFTGQDWGQPKVIGLVSNPRICNISYIFPTRKHYRYGGGAALSYVYASDTWEVKSGISPMSVYHFGATGENGLGLTVCGNNKFEGLDRHPVTTLRLYDSILDVWEMGRNHTEAKSNLGFRSLKNGRCITTGGQYDSLSDNPSCWWYAKEIYDSTHEYSIATNSWVRRAGGSAIYYHADFQIAGKLYVAGGTIAGWGGCWKFQPSMEYGVSQETRQFDNDFNAWSSKHMLPYKFGQVRGWNLNNGGFIGGGTLTAGKIYDSDFDEFWMIPAGFYPYAQSQANYKYTAESDVWMEKNRGQRGLGGFSGSECFGETICLRAGQWGGGHEYYTYDEIIDSWASRGTITKDELTVSYGGGAQL